VHVFNVFLGFVAGRAVPMDAEIVRRRILDQVHPVSNPLLAVRIRSAGWRNEFLVALIPEVRNDLVALSVLCSANSDHSSTYLLVPVVSRLLGANAVPLWLIEEVNDRLVGIQDKLPLIAVQLTLQVDHRTKWGAAFQLRWDPGVPIRNGGDRSIKIDLVHLLWTGVGIGVVPKEAALLDDHGGDSVLEEWK
jgi:hypothetical protein